MGCGCDATLLRAVLSETLISILRGKPELHLKMHMEQREENMKGKKYAKQTSYSKWMSSGWIREENKHGKAFFCGDWRMSRWGLPGGSCLTALIMASVRHCRRAIRGMLSWVRCGTVIEEKEQKPPRGYKLEVPGSAESLGTELRVGRPVCHFEQGTDPPLGSVPSFVKCIYQLHSVLGRHK